MASIKRWTTRVGRVPGDGKWQQDSTIRPDDPALVTRTQLKDLVGVSNVGVITEALTRLGIAPVDQGSKTRRTYNNGGRGIRDFEVAFYDPAEAQRILAELQAKSIDQGSGKLKYGNHTFHWIGGDSKES